MLQYVAEMKFSSSKELCPCVKKELNIFYIQICKRSNFFTLLLFSSFLCSLNIKVLSSFILLCTNQLNGKCRFWEDSGERGVPQRSSLTRLCLIRLTCPSEVPCLTSLQFLLHYCLAPHSTTPQITNLLCPVPKMCSVGSTPHCSCSCLVKVHKVGCSQPPEFSVNHRTDLAQQSGKASYLASIGEVILKIAYSADFWVSRPLHVIHQGDF